MKKTHLAFPLTSALLLSAAVSAEQDKFTYLNSTNRVTLSLRFGLNIKAKFSGVGNAFTSGSAFNNSRRTPNGDPYNYDDGYVLNDSTGDFLGLTSYWGYDNSALQTNPGHQQYDSVADTITFEKTTLSGMPSEISSDGNNPYPGFELAYNRELLEKVDWHDMRFGLEAALNYMRVSLAENSSSSATVTTSSYVFQLPGTTPPSASPGTPFQGTFNGSPGGYSLLDFNGTYPAPFSTTTTPGATFLSQDHFDANLFGGRIGPYIELPLTEKFDLRLSGGLAVGLLQGREAWKESLTLPGGGPTYSASGGGDAFKMLWGYYGSLEATWQFNNRWALDGEIQYQDIGKFRHSFQGREVELDLNRSLFFELGVSYSF